MYPTAQCLYLFYEACRATVSWRKESKSMKSENDPYVVAKINRAKTSKGLSNSRCLSVGHRRISGQVLPNEPTCTNLRMVASPFCCSAAWQIYDEDRNCLWCFRQISGEELNSEASPGPKLQTDKFSIFVRMHNVFQKKLEHLKANSTLISSKGELLKMAPKRDGGLFRSNTRLSY